MPTFHRLLALLSMLLLLAATSAEAQTRRAVLVGINQYSPPEGAEAADEGRTWTDLEGAVHDVEAMQAVLVARHGFEEDDIVVLTDRDATRATIEDAIRKHLGQSQPGDVALFYYAGHGSQVENVGSREADRLDETIVPADAWQGTPDLRDKELRDLFNPIVDTGAEVLMLFDSCHSGSITRGLSPGRERYLEPASASVNDASDPPKPEERGALVLSAAQDREKARELVDESGMARGAFSWALVETLAQASPSATVQELFLGIRARMRSQGIAQEPVLAARAERQQRSFFGAATKDGIDAATAVAVVEASGGPVVLQGGYAVGLQPGAELVPLDEDAAPVRLAVTRVEGLARSEAEVIEGDASTLEPGQFFRIDRWATGATTLRLYVPPAAPDAEVAAARALAASPDLPITLDPTEELPTHVLRWHDGWQLRSPGGSARELNALPDPDALAAMLSGTPDAVLFVHLPPSEATASALAERLGALRAPLALVGDPSQAHYLLAGRPEGEAASYAWIHGAATQPGAGLLAPPPRTDFVPAGSSVAPIALARYAQALAKLWGWLHLDAPPDDGSFPYRLVGFEDAATGERYEAGATLQAGHRYRAVLRADPFALQDAQVQSLMGGASNRYLYVFGLDSRGNGGLLYPPPGQGNVENDFEVTDASTEELVLPAGDDRYLFRVQEPFGVDTFVLLTTAEAIPDPSILNFSGVRTRGEASAPDSPLGQLLFQMGEGARGSAPATPTDWTLDRVSVRTAQ